MNKVLLVAALLLVFASSLKATIYTNIAPGSWTSAASWYPSVPPLNLPTGDVVVINHHVFFNIQGTFTNMGTVQVNGTLDGAVFPNSFSNQGQLLIAPLGQLLLNKLSNGPAGNISNQGYVSQKESLENWGMIDNTGWVYLRKRPQALNNGGYFINCGLLEAEGSIKNISIFDNCVSAQIKSLSEYVGAKGSALNNNGLVLVTSLFYTEGMQMGCGSVVSCNNFVAGKFASWTSCQAVCAGGKFTDLTLSVPQNCNNKALKNICPVLLGSYTQLSSSAPSQRSDLNEIRIGGNLIDPNNKQTIPVDPENDAQSVETVTSKIGARAYPNPCTGNQLNISLSRVGQVGSVSMIDLSGREVYSLAFDGNPVSEFQIEIPESLKNGMYILRIQVDQEILNEKVWLN